MNKILVFLVMFCFSCSVSFADEEADYQAWKREREKKQAWLEREQAEYNKKEHEKYEKEHQKYLENAKKQAIEEREALRSKYADELHISPNEIKLIINSDYNFNGVKTDLSVFVRVEHNDGSNDICHKEHNTYRVNLSEFHCENIDTYADTIHVLPADINIIGLSERGIYSGKYNNKSYIDVLLKDNSIHRCLLDTKPMKCEIDEIYSSSMNFFSDSKHETF